MLDIGFLGQPVDFMRAKWGIMEAVPLYACILAATLVSFAVLSGSQGSAAIFGLGALAFTLGLRHGFDADHIAAIDNVTRKLMQEGKRPITVGTWFSLGHSTVVFLVVLLLVLLTSRIAHYMPYLSQLGSVIGTAVSGTFLIAIGLANVAIAIGIYGVFRKASAGKMDEKGLDEMLAKRGFMNRHFRWLMKGVDRPSRMYPVGFLFGLGFDTATEIALIAISVGLGSVSHIPVYYILMLPALFACGMALVDTTDSLLMGMAYGWAFVKPVRKVYYNMVMTVNSVILAFFIGGMELAQIASSELGFRGAAFGFVGNIGPSDMGIAAIGLFMSVWAISALYYRYGNFR
ncbi:MAG: HoxN/HupN/NixA family nickel/cobalt transporter [Candidatus Micrarchaeota archaeon]|nr:HoxN/HupN/NixA family nickel/cobalt transporter [Candidatus Micrarchaeota archaeon]